jgi:hypothetical protein
MSAGISALALPTLALSRGQDAAADVVAIDQAQAAPQAA